MRRKELLLLCFLLVAFIASAQTINLAGTWKFAMGEEPNYQDKVTLPGSMLTNGKGEEVSVKTRWVGSLYDSSYFYNPYMAKYRVKGHMKFPFFLTPEKHYVGTAWYGKNINIPKAWKGKRVFLYLERPHIETTIYVNGTVVGRDSSLSVPHEFDLSPYLLYGQDNKLDIKVYNGIENVCVGQDSHSVTDQTQGDWNGIIGRLELRAREAAYISDLQIYPDVAAKSIRVVAKIDGDKDRKHDIVFQTRADNGTLLKETRLKFRGDSVSTTIFMGEDVRLWDEFEPVLYSLQAILDKKASVSSTFGMRDFTVNGRQFYINGRKTWLRGTVGNCCFPLTGYPPTDVDSWIKIFRKCKEYGLNMMRFHSYCPPEAAFTAADRVGFYLQPEGPSWPNHGVKLGNGMNIDHYLLQETQRMVRKYGNHPSFCMLAAGNEPAGNWVNWVGRFVDYWKSTGDKRRVYCGASVGGGWAWDPKSEYHVKGGARGLNWNDRQPQSMDDYYSQITHITQGKAKKVTFDVNEPYIAHEQGQWCAFPDLKETTQYTGVYKAANFDIFKDLLRDGGMASQAEKFLMASGHLQTLAYKYEIERNLRTPDYAGFQLLGLNDYSGQGTALVGVLNVFWKEKGYCTADDWRKFCAPVVPLARFSKFTFTNVDTLNVEVELYNAYKEALYNTRSEYCIFTENNEEIARGILSDKDIPIGKNIQLGRIDVPLSCIETPAKLTLSVVCKPENAIGMSIENKWDFWVYPQKESMPVCKDIYICDTLDAKAMKVLDKGGKVLITAAGKVTLGKDVKQHYLPVFWNTSWFKMRPPHTTGAYIDKSHPLFKHFPTDDWSNLNWWELLNKAGVMNLRELPLSYQPVIQPIDTWHVSRKLGMLIEANVGNGKLLMTTMDINTNLNQRIVARQMCKAILTYMESDDFKPTLRLEPKVITDFFETEAPPVNMFTKDSPDELKPKLK